MGRRLLRCPNPRCSDPHGTVLGRLTSDGGIVIHCRVTVFRCLLDARRAELRCPDCGATREFRGTAVFSSRHPAST